MSVNYCSMSGMRPSVTRVYLPKDLPNWKQLPKTRVMGWLTWPLTCKHNFRTTYPLLSLKPPPGAWLIQSVSLTSMWGRFLASPRMSSSGSRSNYLSVESRVKLGGRQSAFWSSGQSSNNMHNVSNIQWYNLQATCQSQFHEYVLMIILTQIFLSSFRF